MAELQEDISLKRFDLGVAQLRLAAVQAQVRAIFRPRIYYFIRFQFHVPYICYSVRVSYRSALVRLRDLSSSKRV